MMKKYAVVKIGGTQCKVAEGDELKVDKIEGEKNKTLNFDEVLLLIEEGKIKIGQPLVKGAKVKATILEQIKGEKMLVATYRAKSRYRRTKGFRPSLTKIKIEKISSA